MDSAALALPEVDRLAPRMLGINEHPYRSVRFFRDPATKAETLPAWMTTIVDLDTGRVGDGRRTGQRRRLELALRRAASVASGCAGRRDRSVRGILQGLRMWLPHRCLSRRVSSGQARQQHAWTKRRLLLCARRPSRTVGATGSGRSSVPMTRSANFMPRGGPRNGSACFFQPDSWRTPPLRKTACR